MARHDSDTGSEYSFGLGSSDEEDLWAQVDYLSATSNSRNIVVPVPRPAPSIPAHTPITPGRQTERPSATTFTDSFGVFSDSSPSISATQVDPDASLAVQETLAGISDNDLSFDVSELQQGDTDVPQSPPPYNHTTSPGGPAARPSARLSPSTSRNDGDAAALGAKAHPRSLPVLSADSDVRYPDCKLSLKNHLSQVV
jgi:exonuclease V